jgi:predicted amidohydrolase
MPEVDLLCYVACWPKPRVHHWRQLLIARAIENQCYVIGVNRVGHDGAGLDYVGSSMVIDPLGAIVLDAGDQEGLYLAEIDADMVTQTREKFPFLKDM